MRKDALGRRCLHGLGRLGCYHPPQFQFPLLMPPYNPRQKVRVAFPPNKVRAKGQSLELSGFMSL